MTKTLGDITSELTERVLSPAKIESEQILREAREKAARIIAEAEKEAIKIKDAANQDAGQALQQMDADLKTAARNFIILLQEKLEKTVAHTTVEEEIKRVFNDNDFLKKTIEIVLHEFSRLGGTENNIEILLPAKEKEDLSKWFIGMFHQKAFNNVNVHFTEKVSFGFKIGIQDTGKHFNFGGGMVEAFQEFCSPRFRKYFLSENEG